MFPWCLNSAAFARSLRCASLSRSLFSSRMPCNSVVGWMGRLSYSTTALHKAKSVLRPCEFDASPPV